MLSARHLVMPVIALTVIVALAQAHSRPDMGQTDTRRVVVHAVSCATAAANVDATCALAGNIPANMVR